MKIVYIETSIISYLTSRRSADLLAAAWQNATCWWWERARTRFRLVTSQLVIDEVSRGDPEAARRRLEAVEDMPLLGISRHATELALALLKKGALPEKATDDALHVAVAAYHGCDYLLTWNCRHIDNAEIKPFIRSVCMEAGYLCPEICTPLELMGDDNAG